MSRFLFAAMLFVTVLTKGCVSQRMPPVDWLSACSVEDVNSQVWCGTYSVFEDRLAQTGRRIDLNVVVVSARSGNAFPDPVFYFRGGPGGGATGSVRNILSILRRVHRNRDFVFIDQRGTGRSNPLDCNERIGGEGLQQYFAEFLQVDFVQRCLQELEPIADVSLYTTPIAMDDIDEVREALGYEKINLYGASYGTRAALIYMRRHAEHVRAAVLKGVAPTNMKNPLPFARAAERGLVGTFEACAKEVECSVAYPDLSSDWGRVLAQFADGWVYATVVHPQTGRPDTVRIAKGVFADGIRHLLYSVRSAREIPRIVNAAADGDFSLFAQRELDQAVGFDNSLSNGMFLTVTCSEDVRFIEEHEIAPATDGTYLGDYRVRRQLEACTHWKLGDVDEAYMDPVRVTTPVLLLSGEYDTATPHEGATWTAESLPNSLHVISPNTSHGWANLGCEARIMAEFLIGGTAEGLDFSCVLETRRPRFIVDGISR